MIVPHFYAAIKRVKVFQNGTQDRAINRRCLFPVSTATDSYWFLLGLGLLAESAFRSYGNADKAKVVPREVKGTVQFASQMRGTEVKELTFVSRTKSYRQRPGCFSRTSPSRCIHKLRKISAPSGTFREFRGIEYLRKIPGPFWEFKRRRLAVECRRSRRLGKTNGNWASIIGRSRRT